MCSVFGFVARRGGTPRLKVVEKIIAANIARGPHAFGLSWIDSAGRLHCFKRAGNFTRCLDMLAIARDARLLIGHLRFATHGKPDDNANNHPHPADGGWYVHNGVIHNHETLSDRSGLPVSTECDSEAFGLTFESLAGTRLHRAAAAAGATTGNFATLGLWPRPDTLIGVRRGNPLHFGEDKGGIYFASLAAGLPGDARECRDKSAFSVTTRGGELAIRRLSVAADTRRGEDSLRGVRRGMYFGG